MTAPAPESSGIPLRALAMVLLSLSVLFAVIGVFSLTGSGGGAVSGPPQAPAAAPTPTNAPAAGPGSSAPTSSAATTSASTTSAAPAVLTVQVLNNSNVQGLASSTASTLTSAGFTVSGTGNYSASTVPQTTVYYQAGSDQQKAEAEKIATTLGVSAEPRIAGLSDSEPGIIVVVTQ